MNLQESENKARQKTFESKGKKLANSLHDVERSALVLHNLSFGRINHIARYIWCTRCFEYSRYKRKTVLYKLKKEGEKNMCFTEIVTVTILECPTFLLQCQRPSFTPIQKKQGKL